MKYLFLLPLGVALLTTSCKSTKVASNSSYQNNPYYGPSSSSYGSSIKDYSSTPSSVSYPSYTDNTYTPPGVSAPAPSLPSVPSTPTYSSSTPSTYTAPAPAASAPASSGSSHVVGSGENLYRISLKHGTSVAAIKSANGLTGDTIHPGQTLRIP